MAEEHRCQAPPEGPRLCVNNCGFFGSPATLGLCSKCYRGHRLKEEEEASAKIAVEKALLASSPEAVAALQTPCTSSASSAVKSCSTTAVVTPIAAATAAPAVQSGWCTTCRKRVGLTGFKCRCGETFCGSHRYPEQHGCTFDFKSAGREVLARANPVVKADKLDKI